MPDDYQQTLIEQHRRIESLLAHPPKQGFWHINAGHVITVLTLLVGGINLFAKLDNRVSNLEDRQVRIGVQVQTMDDKGTHASQKGIYQESEFSKSMERRLSKTEEFVQDSMPRLERIDTNVRWLLRNAGTEKANGSDPKP